jgi:DNA polymerase-4
MHRYIEKSDEVMAIMRDVTPLVEPLSVDEAFLDVAGARRRLGAPDEIARHIRARVRAETGLTASVGAATTKFLAKLGSELAKPDGLIVVPPGEEQAFLAPLPVTRLWGVGPATFRKLERMGLRTIGEVGAIDEDVLARALGSSLGAHLHALAHNADARDVEPHRDAKSIGAEETFASDLTSRDACDRELVRLGDRVGARLRKSGVAARTITLKVRFGNFETKTRARTLPEPTEVTNVLVETARTLLDEFDVRRGIRLLGISCSQLIDSHTAGQRVLALNDDETAEHERIERIAAVERAMDTVRGRFGSKAVRPATLLDRE